MDHKERSNVEFFEIYEVNSVDSADGEHQSTTEPKSSKPDLTDDENDDPEIRALMEDSTREWQFKLSKRKKEIIKVKSRVKSCQLRLEEQDEQLKSLQEQIAKRRAISKKKTFDWTAVRAAHLISKVFEYCEPVKKTTPTEQNSENESGRNENKSKGKDDKEEAVKSKCLYTADFHRFAIALYFFSPKSYFFLSNIAPMFPHRNYIRQWVTSGRVEKLFPQGVYRDEFNDMQ